MIIKKYSETVKAKVERNSLALKAKKESSDEECSTSGSKDEEYAMAVGDFRKFFKRIGRFVRQTRNDKKTFQRRCDDKNGKSDRKCFRCGDLNHLIGECPKPSKDKNQRAFVGVSWSDSGEKDDEKVKNETCFVAQASSQICLGVDLEPDEWINDNGCSKHMTGNRMLFSSYKAYNKGNVIFGSNLHGNIIGKDITHVDDDLDKDEAIKITKKKNLENDIVDETLEIDEIVNIKESRNHPLENVIGNLNQRTLRSQAQNKRMVDNTLFTKKKSSNLIIVQIYVDDIIFSSTCQDMCDEFAKIMHDEFEMSMMGKLNFFLGLQIKKLEEGIFFNQSKYIKEMHNKFGLEDSKPMKTPMSSDTKLTKDEECESVDSTKYRGMIGTMHLGLWYHKGTDIETVVYADSDHAGDYVDRKSTSGICTFMGCCLTYWFSKKQTALAISTTKFEYVSVEKACQQALWMKQALIDYDV
nr:retrovirus-related Pol polyprotein from transposon TNT 1-94 [Tanacetum cinerariifolium]